MKSQTVRLVDVAVIGPAMIYATTQQTPPAWLRAGLVVVGVATIFYNLNNFLEVKRRRRWAHVIRSEDRRQTVEDRARCVGRHEMLAGDCAPEYVLLDEWIRYQDEHAKQSEQGTNAMMQRYGREYGIKVPFQNARQLGVRINNETATLEAAGWTVTRPKIVHGQRIATFAWRS